MAEQDKWWRPWYRNKIFFFLFSFCMKTLLKKVTNILYIYIYIYLMGTNYILTYNGCVSLFSQSYVTLPHVTLGNKNCDLIYAIIEERHWTKKMEKNKSSTFKIIAKDMLTVRCHLSNFREHRVNKVNFLSCIYHFNTIFNHLNNLYKFFIRWTSQ